MAPRSHTCDIQEESPDSNLHHQRTQIRHKTTDPTIDPTVYAAPIAFLTNVSNSPSSHPRTITCSQFFEQALLQRTFYGTRAFTSQALCEGGPIQITYHPPRPRVGPLLYRSCEKEDTGFGGEGKTSVLPEPSACSAKLGVFKIDVPHYFSVSFLSFVSLRNDRCGAKSFLRRFYG